MPTLTLQGNQYIWITFQASGLLALFGTSTPKIESESPVNIFLVNQQGLQAFQQGQQFYSFQQVLGVRNYGERIQLQEGQYFVLVVNPAYTPTALHYEAG